MHRDEAKDKLGKIRDVKSSRFSVYFTKVGPYPQGVRNQRKVLKNESKWEDAGFTKLSGKIMKDAGRLDWRWNPGWGLFQFSSLKVLLY